MKPDFSKFATLEGYYRALSNYWQDKYMEVKLVAETALSRLHDLKEIRYDDDGKAYWTTTGELLEDR